eukprot:238883-Amphidinium_carterae.1
MVSTNGFFHLSIRKLLVCPERYWYAKFSSLTFGTEEAIAAAQVGKEVSASEGMDKLRAIVSSGHKVRLLKGTTRFDTYST